MVKKLVVLVVDDEERITYFLKSKLKISGYEVLTAQNGKEALEQFHNNDPDLIVLDLVMPEMNGFEFLQELRKFSRVPVIILSAKSEDIDKIRGLKLGADDYLPKPFNPNELVARIEAVCRRIDRSAESENLQTASFKDVHVDFQGHSMTVKGTEVHLTRIEWLLLRELFQNMGKVNTYETLLTKIWGAEYRNDIQILRTWVTRLRNKLGDTAGIPELIITIPKTGYMFKSTSPDK
ncbi:MAG: response regulator transcription factor [Dehalococcoidia bacterium]